MDFKVPTIIPQDLQLIQSFIGEIPVPTPPLQSSKSASPVPIYPVAVDDIDSSDESDTDSEREVEANILNGIDEDSEGSPARTVPTDSTSDADSVSSSDSDSEDEMERPQTSNAKVEESAMDFDEDGPNAAVSPDQMGTKNELLEVNIVIPEVEEVGENEELEKVGEVMSIMDKVVIVKGGSSEAHNRASERALDSDTLLVFEDRKVLGYIWETFGPTSQPFYRIQFNDSYPLDSEKIRVSREVFHIPARSNFVFVSQLKRLKGSDASNAHDEEPGDDEIEFSDDEAEREHKRALKTRRGGSETPSRQSTPALPDAYDSVAAENLYGKSPYDNNSYNDMDFGAGPSRPTPTPYDDPYSDSYGLPSAMPSSSSVSNSNHEPELEPSTSHRSERPRGHWRDRGPSHEGGPRDRGRGRGRNNDRRRGDRGRGRGRGRGSWGANHGSQPSGPTDEYHPAAPRSMSPTSMAIARATGQLNDGVVFDNHQNGAAFDNHQNGAAPTGESQWSYQQQQQPGQYAYDYGYQQQPFVQPHINPRFASAFAMSFGLQAQSPYFGYNQYPAEYYQANDGSGRAMSGEWPADWTGHNGSSAQTEQNNANGPEKQPPA